jgi:hypothetical protein
MSTPTTQTNSDTNKPQFLAPETHPTASLDEQHGPEMHHYLSTKYRALLSVRESGVTLAKSLFADWHVVMTRKPEVALAQWRTSREALYAGLASWEKGVTELPSLEELQEWEGDSICETPTGYLVEPDGTGPDGVPSWLRVLGVI